MATHRRTLPSLSLGLIFLILAIAGPAASAAVCDANADRVVDFRDIFIIQVLNNGRRASGPNDPKDADKNGVINIRDAQICKTRCTFAGCAGKSNKPPIAVNDTASTAVNRRVTINVVANDRDPDGRIAASTVQVMTNPLHGRVVNNRNGTLTYIPGAGYAGNDSFRYRVKDNRGALSNVARVSITIKGSNLPPIANAGADINAATGQPVTLDGSASSDPERARLSFSWRFQSKPATSTLTDASIANRLTAAPNFTPDVDGVYELALTVSDGVNTNVDTVRVTATTANVRPNVNAGADQNVLVNTTVNLSGTATDPDNGPGALTLAWTFVAPLPAGSTLGDVNINNANTLTPSFTPDVVGAYTLRLSANDGADTSTDDVVITAAANVAPNANAGADIVVPLGLVANLDGSASNDPDNRPSPLTYQWNFVSLPTTPPPGSSLTNANINNPTTATASFTPDVLGLYLLRLDVSDGALSGNDQVQVKANVAPVAGNDNFSTAQNVALNQAAPGVLANDTDGNNDPLTAVLDSPPANAQSFTLNTNGSFAYTPNNNFTGQDTFTYHANDGSVTGNPPAPVANANSNIATVTIDVQPPNNAPTFTAGPNQTVNEDAGAQSVPGWATAIDDGDAGVTQTLTFNVSNNNNGLFSGQPAISPTGVLTYTPAANANGSATVTVTLQDNGGTANGGVDTSAPQTFTITVNAVNDAPSFTKGADQTVNEDAGAQTVAGWATAISAGPADESSQTLTFNVTGNTNPGLFSAGPAVASDGALTYTPAANASGTATVTVTLSDNGGTANGGVDTSPAQTFTITVNAVNDIPTFTPGGNVTVNEDAGPQNLAWASGINDGDSDAVQTLTFNVISNSNPSLFSAGPSINSATGNVTFTTASNANGSATVTVTLSDNGGTTNGGVNVTGAQVFTITVNPVNDPPVARSPAPSYTGNSNLTFLMADDGGDGAGGILDLLDGATDPDGTAVSMTPATIATANGGSVTVNADGSFTYQPPAGFVGSDTFSYQIQDSGTPLPALTANVTATVTVSDLDGAGASASVLWFIDEDNTASSNIGTQANPFRSLAAFNAANTGVGNNPADTDFIFLNDDSGADDNGDGAGVYGGGITLRANQRLIADGSSSTLTTITGITLGSFNSLIPFSGIKPTIAGGISLNSGNTLRGVIGGNVAGFSVSGGAVGNLTISESAINNTTGGGISITTSGALNVTLDSLSSTGGTNGINLVGATGSFSANGGAISGSTGTAFNVSGGTANITYAGTINKDTGTIVSVSGTTGGSKTLSGAITDGDDGDGNGVSLTSNTGATINFQGGLLLSTGSNPAFTATGGGTVNVCDESPCNNAATGALVNTLTTTTATALNVANTTIGANNLEFRSISANGGTNGIVLNNTGLSGGLSVKGTGTTDGSGGTIQSTTNRGASFVSTSNVALKNMNFTNAGTTDLDADNSGLSTGDNLATNAAIHLQSVTTATLDNLNISGGAEQGINGNAVSNFTLASSSLVDVGNEPDEDGVHFFNMSGTSVITNTTFNSTVATPNTTGGDDHLNLQTNAGTLNLTVSGVSATNANKGSGLLFGIRGTSNATINISNATLDNNFSGGIVADSFDTATMKIDITSITDRNNNDGIQVSGHNGSAQFDIHDFNDNSPTSGQGIYNNDFLGVFLLKSAFSTSGTLEGQLTNSEITIPDQRTTDAMLVFGAGGSNFKTAITNSNFSYRGTQRPITVQGGQDGAAIMDTTITGNNIDIQLDGTNNAFGGILANVIIATPGGNGSTLCADIGGAGALGNLFTHSLAGGSLAAGDIRVRQRNGGPVRLPGYSGGSNDNTAVATYLDGRNTEVSASTATNDNSLFSGGGACNAPVVP